MANAIAFIETLIPTATGAATGNATAGAIDGWKPTLGAKNYALHLHVNAGTATVVLEGVNYTGNNGTVAITPDVILTATGGATGDFYAKTTTDIAYQYVRLRCTAFAGATAVATATGVR